MCRQAIDWPLHGLPLQPTYTGLRPRHAAHIMVERNFCGPAPSDLVHKAAALWIVHGQDMLVVKTVQMARPTMLNKLEAVCVKRARIGP